ncbi:ASCH domain-containing protein [Ruminococcus intestinalis]|uniref:ASCH domain-containing protein n=1 Tax=Ruminococcus intestinalis TaxID=2763066 RepID=UPI003F8211AA
MKTEKNIELRLNDEKRRLINVGDEITFINTEDNRKTLKTEIVNIYKFKSFEELYAVLPLLKCGYTKEDVKTASSLNDLLDPQLKKYTKEDVKTASPEDMLAYYSTKQQEKYGVLGIEIKVIS